MKNKFFAMAMATALITPVIAIPMDTQAVAQDFKDVPKTHIYYKNIMEMREKGIINGYPDGTFKPTLEISRKHVAALLSRALPLEPIRGGIEFKDVPKTHPYYEDIQRLYRAGIVDGEKGYFNPEDSLTRVQMAKILVLAFDLQKKSDYAFPDVPKTHWGSDFVKTLYSNGITTGDGGYFKPNEKVSRQHYTLFLYRAINLDKDFVAPPIEDNNDSQQTVENFDRDKYLSSIKKDPTFQLKDNYPIVDDALKNKKYIEALLEIGDIVKKYPNFVITSVGGGIEIDKKNYKSPLYDRGAWVGDNIGIAFDHKANNNMLLKFDFMDDETVALSKEIFNVLYPSATNFNLEIDLKVKEARTGFANYNGNLPTWENFTGNVETTKVNSNKISTVQTGVNRMFDGFNINVKAVQ